MRISLPSEDASRVDTVPEGELEHAVGLELEEAVNVRPLRALWEPRKRKTLKKQVVMPNSVHGAVFGRCGQSFVGERDDDDANARCMPIFGHEIRCWQMDALSCIPIPRDETPVGSQEVGRCDGSKWLSKDHPDIEPAILELRRAAIRMAREETAIEVVPEESNEYVSLSRTCRTVSGSLGLPTVPRHVSQEPGKCVFFIVGSPVMLNMFFQSILDI